MKNRLVESRQHQYYYMIVNQIYDAVRAGIIPRARVLLNKTGAPNEMTDICANVVRQVTMDIK